MDRLAVGLAASWHPLLVHQHDNRLGCVVKTTVFDFDSVQHEHSACSSSSSAFDIDVLLSSIL